MLGEKKIVECCILMARGMISNVTDNFPSFVKVKSDLLNAYIFSLLNSTKM